MMTAGLVLLLVRHRELHDGNRLFRRIDDVSLIPTGSSASRLSRFLPWASGKRARVRVGVGANPQRGCLLARFGALVQYRNTFLIWREQSESTEDSPGIIIGSAALLSSKIIQVLITNSYRREN